MNRRSWTVTAAAASAAAALAATVWHVARDAAPPTFDDAWYLETSFRLFDAMRAGPLDFARSYVDAFHVKAPLISVLPLPLYALAGKGERVAIWINVPLAALAAWAWSRAASLWWKEHPRAKELGALAGALTALLPHSYGLSRRFLVETPLTALLGLWAWRCAARGKGAREGESLGAVLGLGLLAKSTFPLLAAGFAWPARTELRRRAKAILLVGGLLAATWYAANLPYVAGFAWSAGFGRIARDYAGAGRAAWLWAIVVHGISLPLAGGMAGVALAAAAGRRRPALDDGTKTALWGLAPLLVYAAGVNAETRLVAPLLPVVAALAARAAVSFDSPRARAAAAAALLLPGLAVCADQTFRAGPGRALAFNGAPAAGPFWDRGALVDAVAASGGRVAAVALEDPRLNANNLSSLAAERGLDIRFVSLGYAQSSAEAAVIRLKDKSCDRLILIDGLAASESPAFLNRANAGIRKMTEMGRLKTSPAGRVALAPGVSASVLRLIW